MTSNQPRSAGRRLWWILRTTLLIFIIVALVAIVLGGLGYGGYLGVREIQRSVNSLAVRIDANEHNLNSLRDLVDAEIEKGNPEQQVLIIQLQNELAALQTRLETVQAAQSQETAVQTEQFSTVEANLDAAVTQNSVLADELGDVRAALVALQSDLNDSGVRLNNLEGDVDQLRLQLGTLDEMLTDLTAETAVARSSSAVDLEHSLTLLQLWGVLTNARLALADGDEVEAETAVSQAILLSDNLTVTPDSPAAAALQRLQTRLALAADGFATNVPMVAQDLAAASQELTLLLSVPATDEILDEATPTPTEADTGTATVAPTATAAPEETPLPSPTPTP
ncbi:MAG: hypothetical protein H6656_15115 [Ardenticatenaceae bacterium]|nr:hypothetical protein [Anaerolineales bacterium]MCB9008673.1 hypothetical protein [Ardenticatenaceae bacterium]